ncbi:hypothetical protein C8Q74DRAFT_215170 [Fomes fomentarius]|nr:hypothetical protein C8Q74DRAFT_215170 [Fomes fomentarius]
MKSVDLSTKSTRICEGWQKRHDLCRLGAPSRRPVLIGSGIRGRRMGRAATRTRDHCTAGDISPRPRSQTVSLLFASCIIVDRLLHVRVGARKTLEQGWRPFKPLTQIPSQTKQDQSWGSRPGPAQRQAGRGANDLEEEHGVEWWNVQSGPPSLASDGDEHRE